LPRFTRIRMGKRLDIIEVIETVSSHAHLPNRILKPELHRLRGPGSACARLRLHGNLHAAQPVCGKAKKRPPHRDALCVYPPFTACETGGLGGWYIARATPQVCRMERVWVTDG
jgi:hypothetical protein